MKELHPQDTLRQILKEFDDELQFLLSHQVLTNVDVQKIKNQADISKNAMLTARDESSFNDRAKDKLLNALIRDFENSIQRTLDEAVGRKGDKALIVYRLNKVDRKIKLKTTEMHIAQNRLSELQIGMELLKAYILRSIPEKGMQWGSSKINVGELAKNYEQTIIEYISDNFSSVNLLR